mgnify:CR=1 FL=1
MRKKIVLIDGHSILNRAFYGVPDLTTPEGLHTNAVYGFLNIMFKILDEEKPEYLTVTFDVHAPTFRHEMFSEYKGTRKPMAEELRQQVPVIKEVLEAMNISTIEKAGLEADDLLGTLSRMCEESGMDVSIISGDRDTLQLATEHVKIRIPKTKQGKTEIENYYAADVVERYKVTPREFIDVKALMGDTADNIPGVPKVGEKTATDLMVQFGSLDGIYEHIDEVTKKSVKESLIQNKDLAYLSRELATIKLDSPLTYTLEEARVGNFFNEASYILFKKLEFKNLLNKFEKGVSNEEISASFHLVENLAEVEALFTRVLSDKDRQVGLKVVKEAGRHGELLGVALHLQEEGSFLVLKQGFLTEDYLKEKIALLGAQCRIATADIKSEYAYLQAQDTDRFFDVILAAYLLNPLKNDYTVEDIANEYLNLMLPEKGQAFGRLSFKDALNEKPEDFLKYCCFEAYVCAQAAVCLQQKLEETQMDRLMREIEMPLTLVLFSMQEEGIRVNPEALKDYGEALSGKITELEQEIYSEAGCEFNINSPKQLGEILFEKMGLPGGKKTKTGYSTAADVLEKLSGEYPVVKHILEYRGLTKLKSTYADGLAAYIEDENRIHSTFNQTITATGRISSTEPNLQNIPIRMELGRQIRKVFIPKDGYCFMDADYSQIELRVLASMSGDERLIEAYRSHADIHRTTASQVFHIPFEEVTDLQRRNAKAVNFGIVYGISSFGLSEDLSISRKEAAAYIEQYFETYPQVKQFIDSLVKEAKKNGYAVTLYGRRRPVPELFSSNFMQRSFGERVAMNSPIQGTAADIIKIAMIRVFERLKKEGLKSKLILQVHDELLIETALEEEEQVRMILEEEMVHASSLAVELEIDLHVGINWYEAK